MISLSNAGLITNNRKSAPQTWGGGNIHYLDRQNVACPAKTAIDGFELYRPTPTTLAYKYSCRRNCSGLKTGKTYTGKTRPNATSNNLNKSANYLDRHHPYCKVGYAMQQFKLGRAGNKIFYSYTCTAASCKSRPSTYTSWQKAGNWEVVYLDRQHVRMQSHHVVTGFRLESKNAGGNQFRYKIDYCMLKHPKKTKVPAAKPMPKPIVPKIPKIVIPKITLPKIPKIVIPKIPKINIPKIPKLIIGVPAPAPPAPAPAPVAPVAPAGPTPTSANVTSAPLDPSQIAANAKGKAFCAANCQINPAARLKSCVEPTGLIPCKRCTNTPTKTDPNLKKVCELVCNAHTPNHKCDFYGYLNNKKKAYNTALLAKFGLSILRKYFKK